MFELAIHKNPTEVVVASEMLTAKEIAAASALDQLSDRTEREFLDQADSANDSLGLEIEQMRCSLMNLHPRRFEQLVKIVLEKSGFANVAVTRYSQDGGIDLNARVSSNVWPLRDLHLQVQAKRWLHTVGRREVAELRGSLDLHARGTIVTTSHFSRAATIESRSLGKSPIVLVDGSEFATLIHRIKITP